MGKYTYTSLETEMDETSRLILMVAEDEKIEVSIENFATEFRKAHPGANVLIIMDQWKKWHGNYYQAPTHDYKTGEKR